MRSLSPRSEVNIGDLVRRLSLTLGQHQVKSEDQVRVIGGCEVRHAATRTDRVSCGVLGNPFVARAMWKLFSGVVIPGFSRTFVVEEGFIGAKYPCQGIGMVFCIRFVRRRHWRCLLERLSPPGNISYDATAAGVVFPGTPASPQGHATLPSNEYRR